MKNNDTIKVLEDNLWRKGKLLDAATNLVSIGEPHYFNYQEKIVEPQNIVLFRELDPIQAEDIHRRTLVQATELAKETLANVLPDETIEVKEGSIFGYGGSVTLDPVVTETKSILGFCESALWQVNVWKHYFATRMQPEEFVDCPVGEPTSHQIAVQTFIETIFKLKLADYWQIKSDEAYASMLENDEHIG